MSLHRDDHRVVLGVAEPPQPRTEYVLSWDQLTARLHQVAGDVQRLRDDRGDHLVGVHPLAGGELVATAIATATGVPVVDWVGSGVVLTGLVARHCAEAQCWVDRLGEGLADVVWAFRVPEAPVELTSEPMPGMGDPIRFPVCAQEVPADWLVMPWEDRTVVTS